VNHYAEQVHALKLVSLRMRQRWQPAAALAMLLGLLGSFADEAPAAESTTGIPLSPCRLEHPSRIVAVDAECAKVAVPENRADPESRRIELNVARVPAVSRRKKLDPIFLLAGGPGMAATAFYTNVFPAFARIRRDRDIVLVDQRGTGQSNGLHCELGDEELMHASNETLIAETERCLKTLSTRADVRYYTTSVAVQDLDHIRALLGYEQINLYGASYGTRVAQHYARRFPERTRSVILDGIVPPEMALGPAIALDAEAALANIFARCTSQPDCVKRFGDPAVAYRSLRESLGHAPVEVSLNDPGSGQPVKLDFTALHLAMVLRLGSYTSEQAALLPLSLNLAHRDGNFIPLASQFLLVSEAYKEAIAYGMHNAVVCAEDVPFYELKKVDRAQLERTYLGVSQLDALVSICSVWPKGPIDKDFHAPLRSAVPALLLSGGNDPVTPASYGEQAKRGFSNSEHLVLNGLGHGQLTAPCVDRLMAQFVERGSARALDTSCANNARPMPFFTTLAGPPP
jgi:pimeloyl-ACP methyl ester carboxylesterase